MCVYLYFEFILKFLTHAFLLIPKMFHVFICLQNWALFDHKLNIRVFVCMFGLQLYKSLDFELRFPLTSILQSTILQLYNSKTLMLF